MKRRLAALLSIVLLTPAYADEAGDAVFAERAPWTLDQDGLTWTVNVDGPDAEGFLHVTDGQITLTQGIDPSDQKPILQLQQQADQRSRKIGPFPSEGGDPVLTFFLEEITRDMSRLTGGSPFYIRNRLKDALFRGGSLDRAADHQTAVFRPFEGDPNAAKMGGFQNLSLTFVLDQPDQPIREMRAETMDATGGYSNIMVLQ